MEGYKKLGDEFMKKLVKLEELSLFILGIFLFTQLDYKWWLFPVLLFVPDLGMLGYIINTKIGAVIYNIVHHRALCIMIYILGAVLGIPVLMLIGIIVFSHSSLDRIFDYGFKYGDAFKHTHLS